MVGVAVSREEIADIYDTLVADISNREVKLRESLPVDTTADIPAHLHRIVDDWTAGRKSLRTVPTLNAYAREVGDPPEKSVVRTLAGLDALVNVLDDVVDSRALPTAARIRLTVNAAFSSVLIAESIPDGDRA